MFLSRKMGGRFLRPQQTNFSTLVLAEHFQGALNANLGSCLKAASELNDPTVS